MKNNQNTNTLQKSREVNVYNIF